MKTLIVVVTLVTGVVTGSLATGIVSYNSCGYDEATGNYLYDGNKVAAYGTMDSAMECALSGLLPAIVIDRLGMFGSSEEADRIKAIDAEEKQKLKEETK